MELSDEKRKALIKWLKSMPWWEELPYSQLEAELASVKASDKEAWYWIDKTCDLLVCGELGVFAIEDRIKALGGEG